jgi:hypothetical protein
MSVEERPLGNVPPSSRKPGAKKADMALLSGGVLMVLCCAVGPAVIGAAAGSLVGGWLGIACAVILAAIVGLALHRRSRSGSC